MLFWKVKYGCRYGGKAIASGEVSFTEVLKVSSVPHNLFKRHWLLAAVHTASGKFEQRTVYVVCNDCP